MATTCMNISVVFCLPLPNSDKVIKYFYYLNISGRSILESTAKEQGVSPTVASSYLQTHFASSAYVQWTRLAKSYKLQVAALEEANIQMNDENEPLQYKVKGQVSLLYLHKVR